MKDWSDLEEKYQGMREKDPSAAEDFKKKMTERFQKTVQALEEESQAEKRQIQAMHQQRVISRYNKQFISWGSIYLLKYDFIYHFPDVIIIYVLYQNQPKEETCNELLHSCSQRSPTSKYTSGSKMPTKTIAFPSQRSPSYNSTFQTSP
jgi:hypothetical protein